MRSILNLACVVGVAALASACASGPQQNAAACTASSHAQECEFLHPFHGETSFGLDRTIEERQAIADVLNPMPKR